MVSGVCETEEDLDFEACDLKDLKDEVLKDICNRIGLVRLGLYLMSYLPLLFFSHYSFLNVGYGESRITIYI